MNKNTKELEYGQLSQEFFDFKHLTWKIPNVLSLPSNVDYRVQSNIFSFAGASWRLQMYPNGINLDTEGCVHLIIVRLHSVIPEHSVFLKFCFKSCKGKEFESMSGKSLFNSANDKSGVLFISKSRLKQMKKLLLPNGVLTIMCDMRTKRIDRVTKYIQVESAELLLDVNNTMERMHDNQILSDFKKLFLDQEDCDVTINVKGEAFQAHRLILKARSPVFASTFRNNMKEKSTGIIDIEDCDPSVFSCFLSFLYCGDMENLSVENMFSVFTIADKYDTKCLRKICLQFIKTNLSVDTFCDTIQLALQHSETQLIKFSTDFFILNLQEIIVTAKWQTFLTRNPTHANELLIKALAPNKRLK